MKTVEGKKSYSWLRAQLWHVEEACDKACGCGNCGNDVLAQFAFDDKGVYEVDS